MMWIERDAYDASHVLMIPSHYAFLSQDKEGISDFEVLMTRFAVNELPTDQLHQAQRMYFVSRYLVLKRRGVTLPKEPMHTFCNGYHSGFITDGCSNLRISGEDSHSLDRKNDLTI